MNIFRRTQLKIFACCLFTALVIPSRANTLPSFDPGIDLQSGIKQAFDAYVARTQAINDKDMQGADFLWIDAAEKTSRAEAYAKLKRGDVLMRHISDSKGISDPPGAMVHDWQGLVFIPGVKLDDVLQVLQDYDHQSTYFAPDVEKSKIEEHDGDHFRVYLRFKRKKIVTVVLNTEHDVTYFRDSPLRAHSRSSAIRIAEVDNPGETSEKEKNTGPRQWILVAHGNLVAYGGKRWRRLCPEPGRFFNSRYSHRTGVGGGAFCDQHSQRIVGIHADCGSPCRSFENKI